MKKISLIVAALAILITSCNDDMDDNGMNSGSGTLKIMFENKAGEMPLSFNKDYITANGDTFQVNELKYILSNFALTDSEDMTVEEGDSYHLISSSSTIDMASWTWDVPADEYQSLQFYFGVDSVANHTIANTGDLDPNGADGMIWNWNTGYKFLKLEGTYRSDTTRDGTFIFHVGGDANYTAIDPQKCSDGIAQSICAPMPIVVKDGKTTVVHITADVLKLFETPNVIDLDATNRAHGAGGNVIAENIESDFFTLHHTEIED